jgi:hypothetical protein
VNTIKIEKIEILEKPGNIGNVNKIYPGGGEAGRPNTSREALHLCR